MIAEKKDKRPAKAHVNKQFFRQLRVLLGKELITAICGSLGDDVNIIVGN